MQYREYGETGVRISVLGFGALRLPKKPKRAVKILRRAFDLGVNYVDTAASYPASNHGANERLVGEALRGYRDQVYVATKNHYKGKSVDDWQVYLDRLEEPGRGLYRFLSPPRAAVGRVPAAARARWDHGAV
jgi:aryl-alcohol dehydrogenase-like predicted oxidoreductase